MSHNLYASWVRTVLDLIRTGDDSIVTTCTIEFDVLDNPVTLTTNRRAFYGHDAIAETLRRQQMDPTTRAHATINGIRPAFSPKNVFVVAARNAMVNHPERFTSGDVTALAVELRKLEPQTISVAAFYLQEFYDNQEGNFPNQAAAAFPIPTFNDRDNVKTRLGLASLDSEQADQLQTVLRQDDQSIRANIRNCVTADDLEHYRDQNRNLFPAIAPQEAAVPAAAPAQQPQPVMQAVPAAQPGNLAPPAQLNSAVLRAALDEQQGIAVAIEVDLYRPSHNPVMLATSPGNFHDFREILNFLHNGDEVDEHGEPTKGDPMSNILFVAADIIPGFSARNVFLMAAKIALNRNPNAFAPDDILFVEQQTNLLNQKSRECAAHYLGQFCTNGRAVYDPNNRLQLHGTLAEAEEVIFDGTLCYDNDGRLSRYPALMAPLKRFLNPQDPSIWSEAGHRDILNIGQRPGAEQQPVMALWVPPPEPVRQQPPIFLQQQHVQQQAALEQQRRQQEEAQQQQDQERQRLEAQQQLQQAERDRQARLRQQVPPPQPVVPPVQEAPAVQPAVVLPEQVVAPPSGRRRPPGA